MVHYRCVAVDVDGTLLRSDHQLSPLVAATVRTLRARGIHICVATGKLFASIGDLVTTLGLTGPQITGNGGVIVEATTGVVLTCETLTEAELALIRVTLTTLAPSVPWAWYTADAIYTDAAHGPLDTILGQYHEPPLRHVARLDATLPAPIKILLHADHATLDALRLATQDALGERVRAIRTTPDFLEFMPTQTHKGAALAHVMGMGGYRADEIIAIGDGENDLSMIALAGMGIAMGNAIPAVRAAAQMTTATNDADGVAVALRHLFAEEFLEIERVGN
ncbi:MAG: HAD family phosphatase [Ktedonobacterales bacterium]|nr:HAD family phosphatase [Ktedonobacterales bacterium]